MIHWILKLWNIICGTRRSSGIKLKTTLSAMPDGRRRGLQGHGLCMRRVSQTKTGLVSQSSAPLSPAGSSESCDHVVVKKNLFTTTHCIWRVLHKYSQKSVWGSKQLSSYLNVFTFLKLYWIGCWWEWTQRWGKSCFSSPPVSSCTRDAHDVLSVARRLAIRNLLQTVIGVKSLSFSHKCQSCLGVMKLPRMQSHSL